MTVSQARDEARKAGHKHYYSDRRCPQRHQAPRFVSTGKCTQCHNEATRRFRDKKPPSAQAYKTPEENRARQAAWKSANPHKRREYKLKQYGLTISDFDLMLSSQGERCLICSCDISEPGKGYVDHCHVSGKVRGLLCLKCNTAIGLLDDSPDRLENAVRYLRGFL